MTYLKLVLKGNFRKNKGAFIGIFLLMFLVAVTFFSIMTFYLNAEKRDSEAVEAANYGEMFAVTKSDSDFEEMGFSVAEMVESIRKMNDVDSVDVIRTYEASLIDLGGKSADNVYLLFEQDNAAFRLPMRDADGKIVDRKLAKGEICVPICFRSMYNCNIGDVATFQIAKKEYSFTIVGYFEDPFMGSSMMGIKMLMVSKEDLDFILTLKPEWNEYILNIHQAADSKLSALNFEKELNKNSGFASYCWISLSKEQSANYMMIITNIFSALLIVVVLVFLIAAIVVLSNNISSGIEMDYVNYGIYKSMGMTTRKLRQAMLCFYLIAVGGGLLLGIPFSIPAVKFLCDLTLDSTGLYVSYKINPILMLITIVITMLCIGLFIQFKSKKLSKITPLRAINGGMETVHFSSRLKLPISKKLLNPSLAYRQLVSDKKQYISVVLVTAILTVFMVMLNDACRWVSDEDTLTQTWEIASHDFLVNESMDGSAEIVDKILDEHTEYDKFIYNSKYLLFDDIQMNCYITDHAEYFKKPVKGRPCKYDNEIMITPFVAESLGFDIGDTVNVKLNGRSFDFVITGFICGPNDTGKNFTMTEDGYAKFIDNFDSYETFRWRAYRIKGDYNAEELREELSKLGYTQADIEVWEDEGMGATMDIVKIAIDGITGVMYVLAAIFAIITVSLVAGKMIAREKRDYGIYKSLGVTSKKIRGMLAVRFGICAMLGSVLGIIINVLVSEKMFNEIFKEFGIYDFSIEFSALTMIIPIAFMTLVFAFAAYLKARKVKKHDVRLLIVE